VVAASALGGGSKRQPVHVHNWLHRFCSLRLPSPLSESDQKVSARHRIQRICTEARLPFKETLRELMQMLPRAEKYRSDGCNTRAAWGRAAAEWPEFQKARRLVELFLFGRQPRAIWSVAFAVFARFLVLRGPSFSTLPSRIACLWSRRRQAKCCGLGRLSTTTTLAIIWHRCPSYVKVCKETKKQSWNYNDGIAIILYYISLTLE